MAQRMSYPSLLELEAAHYFKLDPAQLHLGSLEGGRKSSSCTATSRHIDESLVCSHRSERIQSEVPCDKQAKLATNATENRPQSRHQTQKKCPGGKQPLVGGGMRRRLHTSGRRRDLGSDQHLCRQQTGRKFDVSPARGHTPKHEKCCEVRAMQSRLSKDLQVDAQSPGKRELTGRRATSRERTRARRQEVHLVCSSSQLRLKSPQRACRRPLCRADSSTSSTSSLPSVSSSPSVSPSVVCPHLSLDDLLEYRQGPSVSPHTIGLCAKCRFNPPPNVHSPLSPLFRPHSFGQRSRSDTRGRLNRSMESELNAAGSTPKSSRPHNLRRGNSDHRAASKSPVRSKSSLSSSKRAGGSKQQLRDDSLDYGLEAGDLRRLQMSPTLRNSVEFIRNNSIESGRVLKIHKNGEPFEKPLRVCILRGEFANLNHFLDHINTRLLVPLGARYLFHLDGQLVYSVHELKHGSTYVVSGTRTYDYRANSQLKEQLKAEPSTRRTRPTRELKSPTRVDQPPSLEEARDTRQAMGALRDPVQGADKEFSSGPSVAISETSRTRSSSQKKRVASVASPRESLTPKRFVSDRQRASRVSESSQSVAQQKPTRLTRAKSEMSALPRRLKKNVTFMDTGRGSSPALTDVRVPAEDELELDGPESSVASSSQGSSNGARPKQRKASSSSTDNNVERSSGSEPERKSEVAASAPRIRELCTSDVGIQVSDSIDGFLIDLPVELPAKGDDANLSKRSGVGARSRSSARRQESVKLVAKNRAGEQRRGQIVTITERQLSRDEMSKLNDLSLGDHHNQKVVLECEEEAHTPAQVDADSAPESQPAGLGREQPTRAPVASESQTEMGTQTSAPPLRETLDARRLISSAETSTQAHTGDSVGEQQWQYPGGEAASATPTQRTVSQSGPSESVRARVTTPTPSLSAGGGDNSSLSLSFETLPSGDRSEMSVRAQKAAEQRPSVGEMPPKRRLDVTGTLYSGLYEPAKNFRLVWVNGFCINDLYPDNSVSGSQLLELERARSSSPAGGARLTAEVSPRADAGPELPSRNLSIGTFKPSERYANWICFSRRHNELIHPAGSLVVLWCQWTNEQRYYARHTSNVSCVALSTLDLDLAASAQVCDLSERCPILANVHLWSLSTLDTLWIVEDEQLRTKLIFSMRLKNSKTLGCELSVCARDDKQLFLVTLSKKLAAPSESKSGGDVVQQILTTASPRRRASRDAADELTSLRASKVLQNNQVPLFVMKVPSVWVELKQTSGATSSRAPDRNTHEPVIVCGRRCFQVWSADVSQQKLRPLAVDNKSAQFSKLMLKANCLCRLSPGELLVGDSDGNVALLLVNVAAPVRPGELQRNATKSSPSRLATSEPKCTVDSIVLLSAEAKIAQDEDKKKPTRADVKQTAGISCLARITGSLFVSADSTCTVRFWKIKRRRQAQDSAASSSSAPTVRLTGDAPAGADVFCEQLTSINLPPDLGFVCNIILADYNRANSVVKLYIVSTCNTILFGSVKLHRPEDSLAGPELQRDLLVNSSLSVVSEGHETSASSLVADRGEKSSGQVYFTCSLDGRICRWDGARLVWKSMLPSSCVSLAIHPTGFVLAAGSLDGTVYVLDKTSGLLISYFPLTPVRINCLAYSSDGSLLASGCANGSIFILPVYERGLKYKKVSIFQSPHAVVSLQFSLDNRYILTSVTHGSYQELILWDLPNFRYMRANVKLVADKIQWFDSICTGSEEVRAIWENANLSEESAGGPAQRQPARRAELKRDKFVVNLSCHRLVRSALELGQVEPREGNFVIASDTHGYLRLFRFPCYDIQQGFCAARISSTAVNCCRFLASSSEAPDDYFVSTSLDGSICLWKLE